MSNCSTGIPGQVQNGSTRPASRLRCSADTLPDILVERIMKIAGLCTVHACLTVSRSSLFNFTKLVHQSYAGEPSLEWNGCQITGNRLQQDHGACQMHAGEQQLFDSSQ